MLFIIKITVIISDINYCNDSNLVSNLLSQERGAGKNRVENYWAFFFLLSLIINILSKQ